MDPYREIVPEHEAPRTRFERLGNILRRLGLWRWRWIREALGGRWEKFMLVKWMPQDVDDKLWLEAVDAFVLRATRSESPKWPPVVVGSPDFPPMLVGTWHRVTRWSVFEPPTMMRVTIGDSSLSVGAMRFIEFLGSRLAIVAYHREDHG